MTQGNRGGPRGTLGGCSGPAPLTGSPHTCKNSLCEEKRGSPGEQREPPPVPSSSPTPAPLCPCSLPSVPPLSTGQSVPSSAGFVLPWCEPCFDPALQGSPGEEPVLPWHRSCSWIPTAHGTKPDGPGVRVVCHCAEGQGKPHKHHPHSPSSSHAPQLALRLTF